MVIDCPYKLNCNGKDCQAPFCVRKYKLDYLFDNSLLTLAQRKHITLYADDDGTDVEQFMYLAEVEKNILEFVEQGKNLFIHSVICGCGKTSWAIRLLEAYIMRIWPSAALEPKVLFINVPKFLLALKESISAKNDYAEFIKENMLTADIIVWDDIAAKVGSEFELNHLLSFIDSRLAAGKSNIFTSNLNSEQMYKALGDRLTSRICNMSIDIEFHGKDKRIMKENGGNE